MTPALGRQRLEDPWGSLVPAQPVREFGFSERLCLKIQGTEQLRRTQLLTTGLHVHLYTHTLIHTDVRTQIQVSTRKHMHRYKHT